MHHGVVEAADNCANALPSIAQSANYLGKAPSTAPMSTIQEPAKMGMPHGLKMLGETLKIPLHGAGPDPKAGHTRRKVAEDPRVHKIGNKITTTAKDTQHTLRPIHILEKAKAKCRCHHCRHL
jgi:hypothetical protein